jgi:hypothetical protein
MDVRTVILYYRNASGLTWQSQASDKVAGRYRGHVGDFSALVVAHGA